MPLMQMSGQLPDASEIMGKCRDLTVAGSLKAEMRLTITEKNGAVRNRTISMTTGSFRDGQEKRLIKFLEPVDVRGTAMLIVDNKQGADEIWIYLPALKKTRRIVSTEKGKSFMSSEFSNSDLTSPPVSDFVNKHLENSGADQWIIESKPVNDDIAGEYGFSRKISYISKDGYRIQKMEFYNFDDILFKTIEIKSIYPLKGGKYIIKDMAADNLVTKRKSEIAFTDINEDVKLDDSFFSVQNLVR